MGLSESDTRAKLIDPEALAGKDARTLAREILSMTQEELSRAFSKSPIKQSKLRGLERNAAVVLGNLGATEHAEVLERVCAEEHDARVREHAKGALHRLRSRHA